MSPQPNHLLALSLACLAAACGSAQDPQTDAQSPASQRAGEQRAGLVPSLAAKAAPAPADEAPMAIGSLVPDGSCAWIRLASFDALVELMDEFMFVFSGPGGMDFTTALGHLQVEGLVENIDPGRELGLALGFADGQGQPVVTVMLPVLDRGAVIQELRSLPAEPQCFGIDDYVVATSLEEYRPGLGAATLTEGLPDGQLSARVDAKAVMRQLEPFLSLAMEQVESSAPAGLESARAPFLAGLRSALESAERIDLALDLDGDELDLSLAFVAAPDSALDGAWTRGAGTLYDLARCIEDGDGAALLLTFDSASMQEQLLPLYTQALDEAAGGSELEASLRSLLLDLGALWPLFGDSLAATVQAEGGALEATYYFQPPAHETFLSTVDAVLRSLERDLPALRISGPVQGSVDTAYALSFEGEAEPETRAAFERLFPSGQLSLRIAQRREVTAVTLGGDEHAMSRALARIALPADQLPEGLGYALDRVGHSNPAFVTRVDLAGALAGRTGREPDAEQAPVHLTCYGGVEGRVWRFGLRADVAGLGRLLRQ